MPHSLTWPDKSIRYQPFWYESLTNSLQQSKVFDPIIFSTSLQQADKNRACQFFVDDVLCLLDTFDRPLTTKSYLTGGKSISSLSPEELPALYHGVKIVFVLQYAYQYLPVYQQMEKQWGINIVPWIFPHLQMFPLEAFTWENIEHFYLANGAFGTGRRRRHRQPYLDIMNSDKRFYMTTHSMEIIRKKTKFLTDTDGAEIWRTTIDFRKDTQGIELYVNALKQCKWGLSLRGCVHKGEKACQNGKCCRAAQYLSLGMPMAFDYIPYYAFPYVPNKDFVLLSAPEDLLELEKVDAEKYAERSRFIWKEYYCPEAMAKLLVRLVYDEDYRKQLPTFWSQPAI